MLEKVFGPHINNLSNALSRASQRSAMLNANLANINTPGYKRKDMDFNIVLEEERSGLKRLASKSAGRSSNGSIMPNGNSVDLEKEVFSIAETELRYQALTDMTSRHFSTLKSVIKEGK